ncbi:hypothetical protein CQZ93_12955 [Ochrobactrum vermis]|nr:hypothetical protein CQZ93_12955 [Ochrobactrum vermis]
MRERFQLNISRGTALAFCNFAHLVPKTVSHFSGCALEEIRLPRFCGVGDSYENQYVSKSVRQAGISSECSSVGPVAQ